MASLIKTVPCRVPGRSLWFAKAKLFEDAIILSGWEWRGYYERRIPLTEIDSARWLPREDFSLVLRMHDDSRRIFDVEKGGGIWYWKLKSLIDDPPAHAAPLPKDDGTTGSPRERG